jgi:hypothetical protein
VRPDECIQPEELARLVASRIGAGTLTVSFICGGAFKYCIIWISVSFRPHWLLEMYKKLFQKLNIMHFLARERFKLHHPAFNDEKVTLNNIFFI